MVVFMTKDYVQLLHLDHVNVTVQDMISYMVQLKGKGFQSYMLLNNNSAYISLQPKVVI